MGPHGQRGGGKNLNWHIKLSYKSRGSVMMGTLDVRSIVATVRVEAHTEEEARDIAARKFRSTQAHWGIDTGQDGILIVEAL